MIVLFASVVRGGVLLATFDSLSADPDAYRRIAHCLAVHGTYGIEEINIASGTAVARPTAFRPPLYPWLISWFAGTDGYPSNAAIGLLQWLLGIASVGGTYWLALRMLGDSVRPPLPRLCGGEGCGEGAANRCESEPLTLTLSPEYMGEGTRKIPPILAAGLVAMDPLLLQSASLVMTETLATALVVLTLWLWVQLVDSLESANPSTIKLVFRALLIGFAFAAAFLCRPTFILWPLILGVYLVGQSLIRRNPKPMLASAIFLSVVMVFVATWTKRNLSHFDEPIWATSHGGYTLLLANNPPFYEYLRTPGKFGQAWDATFFIERWGHRLEANPRIATFWSPGTLISPPNEKMLPIGEVADDRLASETAIATIKRDPATFFRACIWRMGRLHSPLPLRTGDRPALAIFATAGFYIIEMLLIFAGLWTLGRKLLAPRWAASIALWLVLASVHTFYFTDMRMRTPLVPVLSLLATAIVEQLSQLFHRGNANVDRNR